jgi:lysophospholipase L1-like esterase
VAAVVLGGREGVPVLPPPPDTPLPQVVAAIGDSITQAAALSRDRSSNNPGHSWATGDQVDSHVARLQRAGAAGQAHNLSVSGARMRDAPAQAEQAIAARADHVTFLMGANDACATSLDQMTAPEDFRRDFERSLQILSGAAQPGIFVASIPDIDHLRSLFEGDIRVTTLWESFGICRTFLASNLTEPARQQATARLDAFNEILATSCGSHPRCRFDGGTVFQHRFEKSDVSDLDYFHPSEEGQETLARITWRASYWPEL